MITSIIALLFTQQSMIASQTPRPAHDTGSVAAHDSTQASRRDTSAVARVALDFGSGLSAPFAATAIDLSVSAAPPVPKTPPSTVVQLKFLRAPDTLTSELVSRAGTNTRMPQAELSMPTAGPAGMMLRLYDVQVASLRLVTNDDNIGLVQQRLGLQESIAQLTIDLQEAQRQLAVTESLDKRKLSSSLEVAHAHATADALASRLAVQHQHLAIVEQLLAHWTPVREEIVLTATRVDMQGR